jgi:hypothetical protein
MKMMRVSRQFVESVIVTCLEGGVSNCWAVFSWYRPEEATVTLRVRKDEWEDGIRSGEFLAGETGIYRVTAETIRQGVNIILSGETDLPLETVRAYAREWRRSDFDFGSIEADLILQAGVFGRIIFG